MKSNGKLGADQVVEVKPMEAQPATGSAASPDPEVTEKPVRRTFTTEYKMRIVREVEENPGQQSAILRREGLYSSHLGKFRQLRDRIERRGLEPPKRGRKPNERDPLERRVAELERERRKLEGRLKRAELIIEIQKKASEMLGIPLNNAELDDDD